LEYLDLSNNQLTTIPECLFRLPTTCRISLEGNPLSLEEINRIRSRTNQLDYRGPQFLFSLYESIYQQRLISQQEMSTSIELILANWCEEATQCQLLSKLSQEVKNNLANWLSRLKEIPYYKNKPAFAKVQINLFLNWLANEENEDHLQVAYTTLAEATSTCGDRIALTINELLLHVKLCQSQQLSLLELKELIIASAKLTELAEIAQETSAFQQMTDPVEVLLCYQIQLKEVLNLPIETTEMLYERIASLSDQDISLAKERIIHKFSTFKQQAQYLMLNSFWIKAVQSQLTKTHLEQADACFRFELSEIQAHIHSILARIDLESSLSIYDQICKLCEQDKNNKKDAVLNGGNVNEINDFQAEFKSKESTVWNPNYLATLLFLCP
jgi:hypothetical protein